MMMLIVIIMILLGGSRRAAPNNYRRYSRSVVLGLAADRKHRNHIPGALKSVLEGSGGEGRKEDGRKKGSLHLNLRVGEGAQTVNSYGLGNCLDIPLL